MQPIHFADNADVVDLLVNEYKVDPCSLVYIFDEKKLPIKYFFTLG